MRSPRIKSQLIAIGRAKSAGDANPTTLSGRRQTNPRPPNPHDMADRTKHTTASQGQTPSSRREPESLTLLNNVTVNVEQERSRTVAANKDGDCPACAQTHHYVV